LTSWKTAPCSGCRQPGTWPRGLARRDCVCRSCMDERLITRDPRDDETHQWLNGSRYLRGS